MNGAHDSIGDQILESLAVHRLLTTRQVGEMHTPQASRQRASRLLNELRARGLADRVLTPGRPREAVWFATQQGRGAAGIELPPRARAIAAEAAAGPLAPHTLAVNDVGIAFIRAARARGDECGHLAWRHEVAHRAGEGRSGRRADLVVADAVVEYFVVEPEREVLINRFLELDRGTEPPQRLADKLAGYVRLERNMDGWRDRYGSFPPVLVVFAGRPRDTLERRRRTAIALCRSDPRLRGALHGVPMLFGLLEDLQAPGPFGPAFRGPADPEAAVDVLGAPAAGPGATGTEGGLR